MLQKLNCQRSVALALVSNSVLDRVGLRPYVKLYTAYEVSTWAFSRIYGLNAFLACVIKNRIYFVKVLKKNDQYAELPLNGH